VASRPLKKVVFIVTGNINKFSETRLILSEFGLSTSMLNIDIVEIQADAIKDVAKASVMDAVKKCHLPVIVEDAGLFINALRGFPGPYSSYVFQTIGLKGVLKLMENAKGRKAYFESIVAFSAPNQKSLTFFRGRIEGRIAESAKGHEGFGFDSIFCPKDGKGKTFAEMTIDEKNKFSHRAKAMRRFAGWYVAEPLGYFR
jgi:XTP/dITP diphosphohydrolase